LKSLRGTILTTLPRDPRVGPSRLHPWNPRTPSAGLRLVPILAAALHWLRVRLLFRQNVIDGPAPPNVQTVASAMGQKFLVFATSVEERVGKYREAVKGPILIIRLGHAGDRLVVPREDVRSRDRGPPEGVAGKVAEEAGLDALLFLPNRCRLRAHWPLRHLRRSG
jgi:hypothetical protein